MNIFLKQTVLLSFLFSSFTSFAGNESKSTQETKQITQQNERTTRKLKESLGLFCVSMAFITLGAICIHNDVKNNLPDGGTASAMALGLTALVPTTLSFIETWHSFRNKSTHEKHT